MTAFEYRIHPAIGIARVGDSDDYYIAPETAGGLPINPDGRPFGPGDFRDDAARVRRQGARFEVHRYAAGRSGDHGTLVLPGEDGVARIEWTVHLANKKPVWYRFFVGAGEQGYSPEHPLRNPHVTDPAARTRLIIDPGPRSVSGAGARAEFSRTENPDDYPASFPPPHLKPSRIDTLGGLRVDPQGRLIVLGGHGHSGTDGHPAIGDYANNDGWWDDTADGPVSARLVLDDGTVVPVKTAGWVLVAPPRFAPQLLNLVTLYDTMIDTAIRWLGARPDIYADSLWNHAFRPSWVRDIKPILERIRRYRWVVAVPQRAHDVDLDKLGDPEPRYRGLREFYLSLIRPPESPNLLAATDGGMPMMPMLCGDNCFEPGPLASTYATVTRTQYFYLQQWAKGSFDAPGDGDDGGRGAALDRAALENCVGAAFSPGIEVTWIARNPELFSGPLRIRAKPDVAPPLSLGGDLAAGLEPGDLCKYMALPWQADFNECSQELIGERRVWWWPVQRPDYVYVERAGGGLRQVAWVGTDADQTAPDYVQFTDDLEMVKLWSKLGFVFNTGTPAAPRFVEVARELPRARP